MNNQKYYDDMWQKKGGHLQHDPVLLEKIDVILKMIPKDVSSIIDVGCGDGAITNVLSKHYDVSAIDISPEALKFLDGKVHGKVSSAENIDFDNESFDLVFSSEMLEHLDVNTLQAAVAELKRISKKYILLSVPNDEKLRKRFTKCSSCRHEFHIYCHYHSFTLSKIKELFNGHTHMTHEVCGVFDKPSINLISFLKNRIANSYFFVDSIKLICPSCNSALNRIKLNLGQKIIFAGLQLLQVLMVSFIAPKKDWIVILLKKQPV